MDSTLPGLISRFNAAGGPVQDYALSVVVESVGLTIRVSGNARMVQAQSLMRALGAIFEHIEAPRQSFSIDFATCTGLDSSAAGFFALAAREFIKRGGTVILRNAPERIRRMLVVLGLDQIAIMT